MVPAIDVLDSVATSVRRAGESASTMLDMIDRAISTVEQRRALVSTRTADASNAIEGQFVRLEQTIRERKAALLR